MAENTNTQVNETHEEEQEESQKPDGILTKKINGKTFVTEIYFEKRARKHFKISYSR
ncbi:hypothetical protein [Peptoniphilus asaccharolyticus]